MIKALANRFPKVRFLPALPLFKMRYYCDRCNRVITDDKLIRYLLDSRDRENNLLVGLYVVCDCGNKILIKVEPLIRKE